LKTPERREGREEGEEERGRDQRLSEAPRRRHEKEGGERRTRWLKETTKLTVNGIVLEHVDHVLKIDERIVDGDDVN